MSYPLIDAVLKALKSVEPDTGYMVAYREPVDSFDGPSRDSTAIDGWAWSDELEAALREAGLSLR